MNFRENIYTLREEFVEGKMRFFISFKDGENVLHEVETTPAVYSEFTVFRKINRNLQSFDERHREYSELTDETLNRRATKMLKSVEEIIVDRECLKLLQKAIAELPEIQRRRFLLYFEYEMTYAKIGRLEGCSATSVKGSIDIARRKVVEKLKNLV